MQVGLVASILARRCGGFFLFATMGTFFGYSLFTAIITEWRVNLRRVMVEVDNERWVVLIPYDNCGFLG